MIVVGVAVVCVRLGFWQLHRLSERRAYNAEVRAASTLPPVGTETLLADQGTEDLSYRQADVTGAYDTSHEVVLYGRTLDGAPGNHLLTPLQISSGVALLVDRGWVPLEVGAVPTLAPTERVDVTGQLLPSEPGDSEPGDAAGSPAAQPSIVRSVDLNALAEGLPFRLLPFYLQLQTQDPAQAGGLPRPAPLPELSEGPHLSYAIQWFVFASIAVLGYVVLALRDRRDGRAALATIRSRNEGER